MTHGTGKELLIRAVNSINNARLNNSEVRSYVMDNHPQMLDSFIASHQNVTYVSKRKNLDFGAANNYLLKKFNILQEFTHVLLLNPDAYLDENFFPLQKD